MTPTVRRLANWLRERPAVLKELLLALGIPLRECEGPHDCKGLVLWGTPSQTLYSWDGEGEDPNRDHYYCPACSEEYTERMDEQWAEYHSGLL